MKINKQTEIENYLKEPLKAGDDVYIYPYKKYGVDNPGYQNPLSIDTTKNPKLVTIKSIIDENFFTFTEYGNVETKAHISFIKEKSIYHLGYNPFPDKSWNSSLRFVGFDLGGILSTIGFERRRRTFKNETVGTVEVPELNWEPVIIDSDKNEVKYQRGFVWKVEEKQLLIESIYNNIEIGKIIVRKRSWEYVESRIKKGKLENTAFKDIVDGKQRLNAILEFIQNKYTDIRGYYFKDLSDSAQRKFENFNSVSYGEMGEDASDEDVKSVFLNINFAGVPMSQEHIDFVKSIKL